MTTDTAPAASSGIDIFVVSHTNVGKTSLVRTLLGQGSRYPANPREFLVGVNAHVHVNEQSLFSLRRVLDLADFDAQVWLDSPPQRWGCSPLGQLRRLLFYLPPFRWFFQREVFAVAAKRV